MHFTIEKDVFLKGLSRIQGIVEKRNTIPILANVLLETKDGVLTLTATDLEVGMRSSYPVTTKIQGKVTVAAKKLFEIIKELPEAELSFLAKDNNWIEIRAGKALFNIVGLSADEFPYFPEPSQEQFFPIKGSLLKEMIDKTVFSISADESKYNLNGIFFKTITENELPYLRMVATDGHRLSMIQRQIPKLKIDELEKGVIFPRKGIQELKKLAEDGDNDLMIGFMENNAVIKKDQTIVIMRLVDGEFPDYNRVIPKTNEYTVLISRDIFIHSLRRMSILSNEKSRGIKMLIKKDILEISSSNPEIGDAKEDLFIDYQGPEISIGFNAKYILDILQIQNEENIKILLKDNLSPGLIRPEKDSDYTAVVMPMRL
jgi:DNA polymerase-3 subunit beta